MKKIAVAAAKVAISAALLGYLFHRALYDDSFADLRNQPKHWWLLTLGLFSALAAVSSTFIRWRLLVRALDIPLSHRDAFRLGFIAYLLNFFTLGVIGGDVLKAVFLAREHPQRKLEAASSVVVDRLIGLFALFVVAACAYSLLDMERLTASGVGSLAAVHTLGRVSLGVSLAGGGALALAAFPGATTWPLWEAIAGLPRVGPVAAKLLAAWRLYRRQLPLTLLTIAMSLGTHLLFASSVYLLARGLPGAGLPFLESLAIMPLATLAGSVPLPGGLGAFELAFDFLYRAVTPQAGSQGFVVALAFRLATLLIATIGVVYYLLGRREVDRLVAEAQAETAPSATAAAR